ncbi:MAG: hypothetical protein ACRD2E_06535 [Terriglobales bacterium]
MRIGVVGFGVVGHALAELFGGPQRLAIYDKFQHGYDTAAHRAAVDEQELVFVAVPTPEGGDGSADISQVAEVAGWVRAPVCIKSTVPPGTTELLSRKYSKGMCFSPEYVGETPWHPLKTVETHGFVLIGGPHEAAQRVLQAYQERLGPAPRYYLTTARTAEMVKYMENCFLATKVAFANQFYDLARGLGIDFTELRELWLQDTRIGRSHTLVTAERGFGGRCLPKDLAAMVALGRRLGGAPLLEAVQHYNREVRTRAVAAMARDAAATGGAEVNGVDTRGTVAA